MNKKEYGKLRTKPIEERVKDIINYLLLMVAMIERDKEISNRMDLEITDDRPEHR